MIFNKLVKLFSRKTSQQEVITIQTLSSSVTKLLCLNSIVQRNRHKNISRISKLSLLMFAKNLEYKTSVFSRDEFDSIRRYVIQELSYVLRGD